MINKSSTSQYKQTVTKAFRYIEKELATILEGINLGLSYSNLLILTKLRNTSRISSLSLIMHV